MCKLTAVTESAITQMFKVSTENSFVTGVELLAHASWLSSWLLTHHLHVRGASWLHWRVEAVSNIVLLWLLINYGHSICLLPRLIRAVVVVVLLRGLLLVNLLLIAAQLFLYICK